MANTKLVHVFNSRDDLMQELCCNLLPNSLIIYYVLKQLTTTSVLHDKIKLLLRFNNFVKLHDYWMSNHLQNLNLSCDSLHIIHILDFVFLQHLDGHLFSTGLVSADLDFSKCSLSKISTYCLIHDI